jgi:hypothetical protein
VRIRGFFILIFMDEDNIKRSINSSGSFVIPVGWKNLVAWRVIIFALFLPVCLVREVDNGSLLIYLLVLSLWILAGPLVSWWIVSEGKLKIDNKGLTLVREPRNVTMVWSQPIHVRRYQQVHRRYGVYLVWKLSQGGVTITLSRVAGRGYEHIPLGGPLRSGLGLALPEVVGKKVYTLIENLGDLHYVDGE